MKLSQKQLKAALRMSAHERYEYAVDEIAGAAIAWGLFAEGWALLVDDEGSRVLPIWPAEDFARVAATDGWQHYHPREITLETLLEDLLPRLAGDGVRVAVFPSAGKGLILEGSELSDDLRDTIAQKRG